MQSLIEPNIHPMLVHFAYALTVTATICYLLASFTFASKWSKTLRPAADWMLAFGAVAIIATIAAGFQAYYSVDHDTPSHAAMTTHRNWAVPSGTAVLLLALWRWLSREKLPSLPFKALMLVAALSLSVTAWWGGNIVYNFGLGVKSLPTVTGDGHDHDHGDNSEMPYSLKSDTTNTVDRMDGGHDNTDGHHDAAPELNSADSHHTDVPTGHDNSDGHHDTPDTPTDDNEIRLIIAAIETGWETGNGAPFRQYFLDYDGARYFESGGENTGLTDLVENHVEPEKTTIPDLELDFSNLQIHYEKDFAWAVADSTVKGTITETGRVLDRTGKQTYLFRKLDGKWKVVHTHSSSRAARR